MKAIVVYEAGGTEQLIYTEVKTPKIKEGWSLVKVVGFGINHSEIFTREGKSPSVQFPRILGIECVGIVEESTDENRLPKGQKIVSIMGEMGRAFDGSYAEYVLLPNRQIYSVSTSLSWEELAALPETYSTAFGSLKNLNISESDQILVRGASSGVGLAFLRLIKGKYPALKVVGSSRGLDKKQHLLDAGFDEVILDKNNHLEPSVYFDKILDLVGPAATKDSFKHLMTGGIVCSTGQLGGQWYLKVFDPIIDIPQGSYLTSFYSQNVTEENIKHLVRFVEKYSINVAPEKVFTLEEIQDAQQYLESADTAGKVVVINEKP